MDVIVVGTGIAVIAVALVTLVCLLVSGAAHRRRRTQIEALVRLPPVPGRVVSDEEVGSGSMVMVGGAPIVVGGRTRVMTVQFLPPGVPDPMTGRPVLRDAFAGDMTGATVPVHCDPADPRRFIAVMQPGRMDPTVLQYAARPLWVLGMMGTVEVIAGLMLVLSGVYLF